MAAGKAVFGAGVQDKDIQIDVVRHLKIGQALLNIGGAPGAHLSQRDHLTRFAEGLKEEARLVALFLPHKLFT